ncbi:hypothetical protein F4Y93_06155 [Candidatus Poribacteria bacterium]|nr:hypothetical protein [Candidatus Poribacteria bacterium]
MEEPRNALTEDQMKEAVEMFATGMHRQEIVAYFIDNDVRIQGLLEGRPEEEVREAISQRLRYADPSSNKFAVTKYKEHFENHRVALRSVISNQYEIALTRSIQAMTGEIETLRQQIDSVNYMLDNASETNPVGTSEYLATLNTRNSIAKRIDDLQDKLLERLERVKNADLF